MIDALTSTKRYRCRHSCLRRCSTLCIHQLHTAISCSIASVGAEMGRTHAFISELEMPQEMHAHESMSMSMTAVCRYLVQSSPGRC
jgi:hypothetical protein